MQTLIYKIKVLTNLHAGSGDSGYGIVDKLVQRDASTLLPAIYASGIKGALREYFKIIIKNMELLNHAFGNEAVGSGSSRQGSYRFLSADLLAIPVPADDSPYYRLVCDVAYLESLQKKYQLLQSGFQVNGTGYQNDITSFKQAAKELPVIARNHLDNGQSQNLWYEEVVPHQSEFITAIQYPENDSHINDFEKGLNDAIVQLGGNATVGYGLCSFNRINKPTNHETKN